MKSIIIKHQTTSGIICKNIYDIIVTEEDRFIFIQQFDKDGRKRTRLLTVGGSTKEKGWDCLVENAKAIIVLSSTDNHRVYISKSDVKNVEEIMNKAIEPERVELVISSDEWDKIQSKLRNI